VAKERARAAEDAAFEAALEHARRVQAALRAEVDELKAARARQRLEGEVQSGSAACAGRQSARRAVD
jgi:hypothetical protein